MIDSALAHRVTDISNVRFTATDTQAAPEEALREATTRARRQALAIVAGGADTLPSGIRVIIGAASAAGWYATSSHVRVPGAACAVWVGAPEGRPMLRGGVGPRRAGEVACIAFEPWAKRQQIERSGPYPVATPGSGQQS